MRRGPSLVRTRRTVPVSVLVLVSCVLAGMSEALDPPARVPVTPRPVVAAPASAPPGGPAPPSHRAPAARAAPRDLPVIGYRHVPRGFPADPEPTSLAALTEGLRPPHRLAAYDAPGGRPVAYLPPSILGVPVTVPVVRRRDGWAAVLLPSVNRRIGWLPERGWRTRPLRDRLVVRRGTHTLTWLHDGVRRASWTVAIGSRRTPTPLGRTFVLGRTGTRGRAYAGVDALVLGAVPDDRGAVAPGLRDAHTGIHGWYRPSAFGRSVSNGCVRIPRAAQLTLLAHIGPGTPVNVID